MEKARNGALSIRVSTDRQVEYSPDSQIKLCLQYAKENNIEISDEHIYRDDGISGKSADNRTEFQRMMSDAKSKPKPFDVILVYDFSRFARNKEESVMYKAMLRKRLNIDVVSVTQPLGEGKERVILESMYEAMDEYYILNLAENVKRGKFEKATRGEWSGRNPYGYNHDKENKTLKINKKEAKILKEMAKIYIEKKKFEPVVDYILENNIKGARGATWGTNEVQAMLNNSTYNGMLKCGDFIGKGLHPKIFDDDTWNTMQDIMSANAKTTFKAKRPTVRYEHWLRGLVYCSSCGKVLCVRKGGNKPKTAYPFLQCCGYQHRTCKVTQYIQIFKMEEMLLNILEETFTEKLDINITNIDELADNEMDKLQTSLKRIENKLKRVKSAYADGIDSLEEYKINKTTILSEKNKVEEQIRECEKTKIDIVKTNEVYSKCQEAHKILADKNAPQDIKYQLAHLLFDKIIWSRLDNTITIYYK